MLTILGFGALIQIGIAFVAVLFLYMNTSSAFLDFIIAFVRFSAQIIYVIFGFFLNVLLEISKIAISIYPALWRVCCIFFGFIKWLLKQMMKGIFGTGSQFLSVVSWLFVMCACILYFENIFQYSNDRRRTNDYASIVAENHQNARREIHLQERREVLENEENENEENDNEEAEINLAVDDNDRNRVREIEREEQQNLRHSVCVNQNQHRYHQLYVRLPNRHNLSSSDSDTDSDESVFYQRNKDFRHGNRHFKNGRNRFSNVCIVCMERERCVAVFPCGHLQLCSTCVEQVMQNNGLCPLCQSQIQEHKMVYL